MKFEQSRFQDSFSRCYSLSIEIIYLVLFAILLKQVFSLDIGLLQHIAFSTIFIAGTFIYIYFKFSGGSQYLEITDDTIVYQDERYHTKIKREDFLGYKITKLLPHRVILLNKVYGKTAFSYYAFSSNQRKQIFERLDNFQR